MKALLQLLGEVFRRSLGARALFLAFVGLVFGSAIAARAGTVPATFVRAPYDVAMINIRVLSEVPVSATETDLRFAADLQNQDAGVYTNLSINVVAPPAGLTYTVTDPLLDFLSLPPRGTALAGAESLTVRVNTADLAAVRAQVLSGALLYVTAQEIPVFIGPTKFLDSPTDLAFVSHSTNAQGRLVLTFSTATALLNTLVAGDFLIADPNSGGYQPRTSAPDNLVTLIPLEVATVSTSGQQIVVIGNQRSLAQTLRSGTFLGSDENYNHSGRDLYDPPVENTHTAAEKEARRLLADTIALADPTDPRLAELRGLDAIPWHFNDLHLADSLHLSGEVLLHSSGLRFQVSFREFALRKLSVGMDAGVTANLLLETTGANDSARGEAELANIPLPPIEINVGGIPCQIQPVFVLRVGGEAAGPDNLTVPVQSFVRVGTEIGWDGNSFFTAPTREFSAPHISDPAVFNAVSARANAWAEARLEVHVSAAGAGLSVAPSLSVRTDANFRLEPLANPWWSVDLAGTLVGGLELSEYGVTLAHGETTIAGGTFFHRDSGGRIADTNPDSDLTDVTVPKISRNSRWALGFNTSTGNDAGFYDTGFVVALPGGDCLIGGEGNFGGFLARVSANGDFVWEQLTQSRVAPRFAALLPDGSVAVAGEYQSKWWLARYTTDGVRDWIQSMNTSTTRDQTHIGGLTVGPNAVGVPEITVAGYNYNTGAPGRDPVLFRFGTNGTLNAALSLGHNEDDYVQGVTALRNGGHALVGYTQADVTDGAVGDFNGNGLILVVDAAGQVTWAKALAGPIVYNHGVEGPDGSLYAVGTATDNLGHFPSILATKFSASGTVLGHVVIAEDPDWSAEFSNRVDQPFDAATQVEWTPAGPLLVGTTGSSTTRRGWAAQLTEELGVSWFTSFDNGSASVLYELATGTNGFYAMGWSEGLSSTFNNPARQGILLLKLPWEGLLRFGAESDLTSHYLQPRSANGLEFQEFHVGPNAVYVADLPFVASPVVSSAGPVVPANLPATFPSVRLERKPPEPVPSYRQWVASFGLTGARTAPSADPDRDGVPNGVEFYFGTNPTVADNAADAARLSAGVDRDQGKVTITFRRSLAAAAVKAAVESSTSLSNWTEVSGVQFQKVSQQGNSEVLQAILPSQGESRLFRLRLQLP